jgi:hypothetical protein
MAETDRSLGGVASRNVPTRELRNKHGRRGWALVGVAALILVAISVGVLRTADVDEPAAGGADSTPEGAADRTAAAAIGWVAALDAGTVLPTDVTGRLNDADADLARSVTRAWGELTALRSQPARVAAVAWLAGLADGTVLVNDVVDHLEPAQPMLASAVTEIWAEATASGRSGPAGGG